MHSNVRAKVLLLLLLLFKSCDEIEELFKLDRYWTDELIKKRVNLLLDVTCSLLNERRIE